jgi:SAM-dependent methyltransferase
MSEPAAGPENHFAENVAARYDAALGEMAEPELLAATVDTLAELAAGRPALELAIGTGRVALALAAAGVEVHGVELSQAMVDQLRAKDGGAEIPVAIGDMATTRVPGRFGLVYLVFNTIGNLTTQDAQVACFANAAAHLVGGGVFVIELGVPQLRRLPPGDTLQVFDHSPDHVGIDEYDPVTQGLVSHHWSRGAGWSSLPFRYVWPAELDLMARLAGMRLRDRWSGWGRAPFRADSVSHVSVWELPEAAEH